MGRRPARHYLAQRGELAHVVAVVVADEGDAAEGGMARRALENGEEIDRLVPSDCLHRAAVGQKAFAGLPETGLVGLCGRVGPVLRWPIWRNMAARVLDVT